MEHKDDSEQYKFIRFDIKGNPTFEIFNCSVNLRASNKLSNLGAVIVGGPAKYYKGYMHYPQRLRARHLYDVIVTG